jgi:hypothetical protein
MDDSYFYEYLELNSLLTRSGCRSGTPKRPLQDLSARVAVPVLIFLPDRLQILFPIRLLTDGVDSQ